MANERNERVVDVQVLVDPAGVMQGLQGDTKAGLAMALALLLDGMLKGDGNSESVLGRGDANEIVRFIRDNGLQAEVVTVTGDVLTTVH